MPLIPYGYYTDEFTGADTAAPLVTTRNLILTGVDIMIKDNACDVGSRTNQGIELGVGDTQSWGDQILVNLNDIWIKNHTAGSNATVAVTGWIVKEK